MSLGKWWQWLPLGADCSLPHGTRPCHIHRPAVQVSPRCLLQSVRKLLWEDEICAEKKQLFPHVWLHRNCFKTCWTFCQTFDSLWSVWPSIPECPKNCYTWWQPFESVPKCSEYPGMFKHILNTFGEFYECLVWNMWKHFAGRFHFSRLGRTLRNV